MQPPSPPRCAQCGAPLHPDQRFCQSCGAPAAPPQPARCRSCGAPLAADGRFCEQCGQPAGAPPVSQAPVALPTRRRRGCLVATLSLGALSLVLLLAGGVLLWAYLRPRTPPADEVTALPTAAAPLPAPTFAPLPIPPDTDVIAPPPDGEDSPAAAPRATDYMPAPGLRLRSHISWPDGEEGDVAVVTASLGGPDSVSSVELILDAEDAVVDGFVTHLVTDTDGVYAVEDASPDSPTLWLGQDLYPGAAWTAPGVQLRVVAVDAPCNLPAVPDIPAEGCLVIGRDFTEVGFQDELVLAPGYGAVLARDPTSDHVWRELRAVETVGLDEASATVWAYARNAGQVLP